MMTARKRPEHMNLVALAHTLGSLDPDELMWIRYCLHHNTQTLTAACSNRTAQSLYQKGVVEEGSGHVLDLPFPIPDAIWRYLLEHRTEFLPKSYIEDRRFIAKLENFRKALRPRESFRRPL